MFIVLLILIWFYPHSDSIPPTGPTWSHNSHLRVAPTSRHRSEGHGVPTAPPWTAPFWPCKPAAHGGAKRLKMAKLCGFSMTNAGFSMVFWYAFHGFFGMWNGNLGDGEFSKLFLVGFRGLAVENIEGYRRWNTFISEQSSTCKWSLFHSYPSPGPRSV